MLAHAVRPALALGFTALVLASPAWAQPPGAVAPAPRDSRHGATGTAIVRGRITAGDTGKPLRRARVRLTGAGLPPQGLTASTNLDGRYELKDLPAGRYTLQVSRSGYLMLNYGQRRPLEPGKPLQLADRQTLEHIDFSLPRTSVITGRVVDEFGEPVADAMVFAMRSQFFNGRRRVAPAMGGPARTDDAGQFRVSGLGPGSYYVMAMLRDTWNVTENGVDTLMGYENTYFPGSTLTNARRVTVGVGQEMPADIALIPGRAATISGVAFDSTGRPLAGRGINLGLEITGPQGGMMMSGPSTTVGPDGAFTMKDVPPGEYRLRTQTTVTGKDGQQIIEAAATPLIVDGMDVINLSVTTTAGWTAKGIVVTANNTPPTLSADQVRIAARALDSDNAPTSVAGMNNPDSGRVKNDWSFVVNPLFAASRLSVSVPDGWALTAIIHDGADVTDRPIEMKSGEEMNDLQIVITDHVSTVLAQVTDGHNTPVADGTLLVFPEDNEKWVEDSRWVRSARADQQGQFQVRGLPAGNYLAVAVDYVESGMWNDPEYLESLRPYAQKFSLANTGTQSLSLKLTTP